MMGFKYRQIRVRVYILNHYAVNLAELLSHVGGYKNYWRSIFSIFPVHRFPKDMWARTDLWEISFYIFVYMHSFLKLL